tara:strand:+ start:1957 stop:2433 length:477 start_codon:yes stop_codon:yes gene_type:complete
VRCTQALTRLGLLLLGVALAGCAWKGGGLPDDSPATQALRQQILVETLGQIGRPYRYGGGDGAGFDCSGLALHVYADVGIQLPRTAAKQMKVGRSIRASDARPGDLQFFRINGGHHVVVDIGNGRGVHAPAPGRTVEIARIDSDWWQKRRLKTVRVLP